jgi:hypothetical protein
MFSDFCSYSMPNEFWIDAIFDSISSQLIFDLIRFTGRMILGFLFGCVLRGTRNPGGWFLNGDCCLIENYRLR